MADRMRVTSLMASARAAEKVGCCRFYKPPVAVAINRHQALGARGGLIDRCRKPQMRNLLRTDTPRSMCPTGAANGPRNAACRRSRTTRAAPLLQRQNLQELGLRR